MATGDTLYGAAFVQPVCGATPKAKRVGILGRRQFFAVLAARITIQWPRSLRSGQNRTQAFSRQTPFNGWPTNSAGKVVGGIGGRWTALRWPPRTCTKSCNPCALASVPGTSRARDPLRGHGPAGGGSVRSSSGCRHAASQSHRDGHAGRRLEACIASGAFARRKASSDGERRTRAHHKGASARDEAEKISGPRACSLAEGLGRQGQGLRKGQTLGQGEKDARISRASPKESPATRAKLSRRKLLQRRGLLFGGVGSPPVGGGPGAC